MGVVYNGGDIAVDQIGNQPEHDVDRQAFAENVARVFGDLAVGKPVIGRQAMDQFTAFDVDFIQAFFDNFVDVVFVNRSVFVDGDNRFFNNGADFVAGNVDNNPVNAAVGFLFGRFYRIADRKGSLSNIRNDTVFDSFGSI